MYATAGLRLLPAAQASGLLDTIATALSHRPACPFAFVEARILSGEEEAVFGWLSLNHLLDSDHRGRPTAGWLDLGGASTQVSHAVADVAAATAEALRDSEQVSTRLPPLAKGATVAPAIPATPTSHLVFRRSYLRFGKEEAFARSCRLLVHQALAQPPNQLTPSRTGTAQAAGEGKPDGWDVLQAGVAHPCLLRGDSLTLDLTSILSHSVLARSLHGPAVFDRRLQPWVHSTRGRVPSIRSLGSSGNGSVHASPAEPDSAAGDMSVLRFYGTGQAGVCESLMSQLIVSHDDVCASRDPAPPGPGESSQRGSTGGAGVGPSDTAPPYRGCDLSRHSLQFEGSFYGAGNYYYAALQLGLAAPDRVYELTPRDYATAAAVTCGREAGLARAHWDALPRWNQSGARTSLEWNNARWACA